jgi:hypothetical protein
MVHCRHERPSCQNDDESETSPQAEAQAGEPGPVSRSLWWRLPTSVRIRWWRETDYNKLEASAELLEIVRQALSESSGAP